MLKNPIDYLRAKVALEGVFSEPSTSSSDAQEPLDGLVDRRQEPATETGQQIEGTEEGPGSESRPPQAEGPD